MPITLKQLFVPFLFLICGWILGILQFLREKMHAHFRRQRMIEQEKAPPIATAAPPAIEAPLSITDIEMEPETAPEIPKQSRIDLIARTVSETPPVATPVAPTAIESPPSDYDISSPVVVKKSNPPVKPKTSATKLPPSDPDTTSHPVPTTKSIAPVNPSTPVITALPSNASPLDPLAIIDISSDPETDSDDEEIELKTVVTIVDVHQQPKEEKATDTKSIIQPKLVAPASPPVKKTETAFESPPTDSDSDSSSDSVTDFLGKVSEPQIVVVHINPQPQTVVDQKSAPKSLIIKPKIITVTSTKVLTGLDDIVVDRSSDDDPDAISSPAFEMESH